MIKLRYLSIFAAMTLCSVAAFAQAADTPFPGSLCIELTRWGLGDQRN